MPLSSISSWQQSNLQYFWNFLAIRDNVVQFYENDHVFLNSLEGFTGSGLLKGDAVILILTEAHLKALKSRLEKQGFDIPRLIAEDLFVPLDCDECLQNFMVKGKPDAERFNKLASGLVRRSSRGNRKVRLFGEMVHELLRNSKAEASLELEKLWDEFYANHEVCVYCAYHRNSVTTSATDRVCTHHTKVIDGLNGPSTEIRYKTCGKKVQA